MPDLVGKDATQDRLGRRQQTWVYHHPKAILAALGPSPSFGAGLHREGVHRNVGGGGQAPGKRRSLSQQALASGPLAWSAGCGLIHLFGSQIKPGAVA